MKLFKVLFAVLLIALSTSCKKEKIEKIEPILDHHGIVIDKYISINELSDRKVYVLYIKNINSSNINSFSYYRLDGDIEEIVYPNFGPNGLQTYNNVSVGDTIAVYFHMENGDIVECVW
jgi:hypothetical protein